MTAIVFVIAIFLDKKVRKFFAHVYLSLISFFFIFAIATLIGSLLDNNYVNLVIHILGHNILIYLEAVIFAILSFSIWKDMRTTRQQEEQKAFEGQQTIA